MTEDVEHTFARLVEAAINGERCPTGAHRGSSGDKLSAPNVKALALAGRILVEVYSHNWRRVKILTGEHAGTMTMKPPLKRSGAKPKPYMTMDATGVRRHGQLVADLNQSRRLIPYAGRE